MWHFLTYSLCHAAPQHRRAVHEGPVRHLLSGLFIRYAMLPRSIGARRMKDQCGRPAVPDVTFLAETQIVPRPTADRLYGVRGREWGEVGASGRGAWHLHSLLEAPSWRSSFPSHHVCFLPDQVIAP